MSLYIVLALAAAALAVVFILKRKSPAGPGRRERELYRKLLGKAFGDKAQVERLVEVERRRNPGAGRAVWLKDAIDRWERHNR